MTDCCVGDRKIVKNGRGETIKIGKMSEVKSKKCRRDR